MATDDNYTNVLLEEMNSKFDQLIEVLGTMNDELATKATSEELAEVKTDVKIIKAAVTEHSRQLDDHEQQLAALKLQNS